MKNKAYINWLWRESGGDRNLLAGLICSDALLQGEMALDLLEETGDKEYSKETFDKAA